MDFLIWEMEYLYLRKMNTLKNKKSSQKEKIFCLFL